MAENRSYKDSVFTDLFASDEKALPKALSLCNALLGTNFTDEHMLKNVTLENVIYAAVKNDIAYLLGDKLIILLEHQSTINQNMPLRCLLYIAREYEKILDAKQRYARLLQKIPTPEFFVLYNGTEDYPLKTQLKLSDAFEVEGRSSQLELIVTVFNINADKNCELLNECKYLKEYSVFIETVRKYLAADKENGFTKAIKDCIGKGILKEYLTRKSREVMNMLVCDYDYATDMAVQVEEAREQALEQGIEKGIEQGIEKGAYQNKIETARLMKQHGYKKTEISLMTGLSLEEIEKL